VHRNKQKRQPYHTRNVYLLYVNNTSPTRAFRTILSWPCARGRPTRSKREYRRVGLCCAYARYSLGLHIEISQSYTHVPCTKSARLRSETLTALAAMVVLRARERGWHARRWTEMGGCANRKDRGNAITCLAVNDARPPTFQRHAARELRAEIMQE